MTTFDDDGNMTSTNSFGSPPPDIPSEIMGARYEASRVLRAAGDHIGAEVVRSNEFERLCGRTLGKTLAYLERMRGKTTCEARHVAADVLEGAGDALASGLLRSGELNSVCHEAIALALVAWGRELAVWELMMCLEECEDLPY